MSSIFSCIICKIPWILEGEEATKTMKRRNLQLLMSMVLVLTIR